MPNVRLTRSNLQSVAKGIYDRLYDRLKVNSFNVYVQTPAGSSTVVGVTLVWLEIQDDGIIISTTGGTHTVPIIGGRTMVELSEHKVIIVHSADSGASSRLEFLLSS